MLNVARSFCMSRWRDRIDTSTERMFRAVHEIMIVESGSKNGQRGSNMSVEFVYIWYLPATESFVRQCGSCVSTIKMSWYQNRCCIVQHHPHCHQCATTVAPTASSSKRNRPGSFSATVNGNGDRSGPLVEMLQKTKPVSSSKYTYSNLLMEKKQFGKPDKQW